MLNNVQALRFLAALWVAVFHLNLLYGLGADWPWLMALAKAGYAGVDVFFVISGYIMARTTAGTPSTARQAALFLGHRFARIYSGWWPFFFIYLAFYAATRGIAPEKRLLSSFLLLPTLLPHHLLEIAWTLSFELFFYLCTALVLAWNRARAAWALLAWAGVTVLLNAVWLARGYYHPDGLGSVTIAQWFFFYPLTLEFIGGFLLHELLARRSGPARAWPWLAGLLAFAAAIVLYQYHGRFHPSGLAGLFHAPERALLWGGLAVCLVGLAVTLEQRGITPLAWAQPLGDASYSIYLGHLLVFDLLYRGLARLAPLPVPVPGLAVSLAVLLAMTLGLRLYYLGLERPLYRWARGRLDRLAGPAARPPVTPA